MKPLVLLSVLALVLPALPVKAQVDPSKPNVVVTDGGTIEATVLDIDHETRNLTVQGPKGRIVSLTVSEAVHHLSKVKKGDKIKVHFYQSIAVYVHKTTDKPEVEVKAALVSPEDGDKADTLDVETLKITATVVDINYDDREITLKGPKGNTETFKVGENVKRFKEVKKGDQLVIRYTRGVAVSLVKE